MRKIINVLLFVVLGSSFSYAQNAKNILDKLTAESKTYKTIQGTFEYKLENKAANVFENSKGTFLIKGDKYFVNILGAETYFDGENLYSYIKEVEEVTLQKPDMEDEGFLKPSNLFTIYQKGYDYKYVGKIIEQGKNLHVIDLFPKKEDKNYKKLVVKIDVKTNRLLGIKSIGKQGDDVVIVITEMKINKPIADSKFTFDTAKHPDVEVIDMR